MKNKEAQINSIIDLPKVKLRVVESIDCTECYFRNQTSSFCSEIQNLLGSCCGARRSDFKSIIFEEIKEDEQV